jgi:hypothetical protein
MEEDAETAIQTGRSHQEAFESLAKEFQNKEELFETLSKIPSISSKKRCKFLNYSLAFFLLTTCITIFHAAIEESLESIVLVNIYFIFLIRSVLKWRIKHYFWIAAISGFFILLVIGLSIIEPKNLNDIHTQLLIPQCILLLILSLGLEQKLLPNSYSEKVKEKDENNRLAFQKVYRFEGE